MRIYQQVVLFISLIIVTVFTLGIIKDWLHDRTTIWGQANGVLIHSYINQKVFSTQETTTAYLPTVLYSYQVEKKQFKGTRIWRTASLGMSRDVASQTLDSLKKQPTLLIKYNLKNPEESYIYETSSTKVMLGVLGGIASAFFLATLLIAKFYKKI